MTDTPQGTFSREQLEELLQATPFQTFQINMTNGDSQCVNDPKFVILMKSKLVVGEYDSDKVSIWPLSGIAGIEVLQTN